MTNQSEDTTLRRIQTLFGRMPYGAIAHFIWTKQGSVVTPTLADVEANLESLVATLTRVAAADIDRDRELYKLREWARSVRELAEEAARLQDVVDEPTFTP